MQNQCFIAYCVLNHQLLDSVGDLSKDTAVTCEEKTFESARETRLHMGAHCEDRIPIPVQCRPDQEVRTLKTRFIRPVGEFHSMGRIPPPAELYFRTHRVKPASGT